MKRNVHIHVGLTFSMLVSRFVQPPAHCAALGSLSEVLQIALGTCRYTRITCNAHTQASHAKNRSQELHIKKCHMQRKTIKIFSVCESVCMHACTHIDPTSFLLLHKPLTIRKLHTHTHTHTQTYIHACIHTYNTHTYMDIYMHAHLVKSLPFLTSL